MSQSSEGDDEKVAIFVWGENPSDQLGLGSSVTSVATPSPVVPPGGRVITFTVCSDNCSVLVDARGQVYYAGKAANAKTFLPILEGHVVTQVGCGLQFLVALLDQRLVYYGFASKVVEKLPLGEMVSKVTCGNRHCLALTAVGNVFTWGSDDKGQLGHGLSQPVLTPRQLKAVHSVEDIAAGKNTSCCVTKSGSVYAWGAVVARRVAANKANTSKPVEVRVLCGRTFCYSPIAFSVPRHFHRVRI
jgi:alpha-tubulin suppressor-like RCC1 family protein